MYLFIILFLLSAKNKTIIEDTPKNKLNIQLKMVYCIAK